MPFSIYIQPSNTMWRPGSRMANAVDDAEIREILLDKFSKEIASIYAEELVNAIDTQRYAARWAPLSEDYLNWKRDNNLSTNIWEATSLIRDNIISWKSKDAYVVGIKKDVRYPGSNLPAYLVIKMLEFGTSKMPARPLFLPVKKLINGRLNRYWDEFIDRELDPWEGDDFII